MPRFVLPVCLLALLPGALNASGGAALPGLDDALAWEGLVAEDLAAEWRDTVNRNAQTPADPWRVRSAALLTESPLTAAEVLRERASGIRTEGQAGAGGSWDALLDLAAAELRVEGASLCGVGDPGGTLIDRSVAWEATQGIRRSKREVKQLNEGLDERINRKLGDVVAAADGVACYLEAAFAGVDEETRAAVVATLERALAGIPAGTAEAEAAAETLTGAWAAVDRAALLTGARAWADVLAAASLELASVPPEAWPARPEIVPTQHGEVWIGSPASNSGTGDPFLIVDPGGDDQWRVLPDREELPAAGARAIRGWIDLAGDDLWQTGAAGAGGALFSVSAGIDVSGDDTWRSGRLTAGAAAFGVALVVDRAGADIYDSGVASQGFAAFGVGAARDLGDGGDTWKAKGLAQGFALPGGVGVLHEEGGDDTLELAGPGGQGGSLGWFPVLGGGFGLLLDEFGDDRRTAARGDAQAACRAGGVAVALDVTGADVWDAGWRHAQGAAAGECVAALIDLAGADRSSASAGAQGYADGRGSAVLFDAAGNDRYEVGYDGPGVAEWGSVGLLVDAGGSDAYVARTAHNSGGIAIGLRLDLDGDAVATDASSRGLGGLGYRERPDPPAPAEVGAFIEEWSRAPMVAAETLNKLGTDALAPALARVADRRPAETDVVHRFVTAFQGGVRVADDWGGVAIAIADDALARDRSADDGAIRWHLTWLAGIATDQPAGIEPGLRAATASLDHPNGFVRAKALGVFAAIASNPAITVSEGDLKEYESHGAVALSRDAVHEVRWAAVDLLEATGGPGAASLVAGALRDGDAAMRERAERALWSIANRTDGVAVARALFPLAEEDARLCVREAAIRLLPETKHREVWDVVEPLLGDADPRIRRAAAEAARGLLPNRKVEAALAARLEAEDDPRVRDALPAPEGDE